MHFVKELRSRLFPELQIVYTCFLFYFSRQCRQCCAARPTPSWTSSFWVVTPLLNCPTEKSSPHTSGSMEPARISAAKIELWTRFRRDPKVSLLPFVFIHHRNCAGEILNRLAWVVNLFITCRDQNLFLCSACLRTNLLHAQQQQQYREKLFFRFYSVLLFLLSQRSM